MMNNKFRATVSVFVLTFCMAVIVLGIIKEPVITAKASYTEYGFEYEVLSDGTTKIIKYIGTDTVLDIPNTLGWRSISVIGKNAFINSTNLTSVTLPDFVKVIEEGAFYYCSDLTSVTIPNGLTTIGEGAFRNCKKLQSIFIPSSVTSIGELAFKDCDALKDIMVDSNNANYASEGGILYTKDKTRLITYPAATTAFLVNIPNGVKIIDPYAFYKCKIVTMITVPNTVTSIGECAFSDCSNLTLINIPNSVSSISDDTFYNCKNLTGVIIPESVTSIGKGAFAQCYSLTGITIPDSVTNISPYAFYECKKMEKVVLSNHLKSIEDSVFYGCISIKSIVLPESLTLIGPTGFGNCSALTSINIPASITSIGETAFIGCTSLAKLTIPDSVTSMGNYSCGYYYDSNTNAYLKIADFSILCNIGSAAEQYAINNLLMYVKLNVIDLSGFTATLSNLVYSYDGIVKEPAVTIVNGTTTLVQGVDYIVLYTDNINPGIGTATIIGLGKYTGTITKTFEITKSSSSGVTAMDVNSNYDGNYYSILVTAPVGAIITYSTDSVNYTTTNPAYISVGNHKVYYKVSITNYNDVTGYATVAITAKSISALTATLSKTSYSYDGTKKEPTIEVKGLVLGTDFTVAYSKNTNLGTAKVTITGIGNYTGTLTKKFKIIMGVPTITATAGTDKAIVKWKKVTGASGYEVCMASTKTGKYTVIKTVKSSVLSLTKTGLTTGKTYYFKVRAYKTVDGKKVYGAYTTIKNTKVK